MNSSKQLSRLSSLFAMMNVFSLMLTLLMLALSVNAGAQTVSYAEVTLGGGFSYPSGVAVDGNGNVFVADTSNSAVIEIPPGCVSSTCVETLGGGFNTPTGVAVDKSGNVFVADDGFFVGWVKEIPPGCTTASCVKTLAAAYRFGSLSGVAVDGSGNIFVADTGDGSVYDGTVYDPTAVKEIPAADGYMTVKALYDFYGVKDTPFGVAVDGNGDLFVGDTKDGVVMAFPLPGDTSYEWGGGLGCPRGLAVDGSGNAFVADSCANAVKEIPPGCTTASCVMTLGSGFSHPAGVAVDGNGNVFVADSGNNQMIELLKQVVELKTGYTLTGVTSVTIAAGSSSTVALNLTSTNYNGTVSFETSVTSTDGTASNVSANAPSVTLTNGGNGSSVLTVTANANAVNHAPATPWQTGGAVMFCAVLLGAPFSLCRKRATVVLLVALAILLVGFLMSCGGGGSSTTKPTNPTPVAAARTYTVTVIPTGTGTVTNPAAVNITVTVP